MMKIMPEVSAVWITLSFISRQPSVRCATLTTNMAMAPTAAPSVGVNTPP